MKIIYEDKDLIVADKPAGMDIVSLGEELSKQYLELRKLERNGLIHRLDKNTSGIILFARTQESLIFFQKQFINRDIEKRYIALATGRIEENKGEIKAAIGRSPKDRTKQKVYLPFEPGAQNQREALTRFTVLKRLASETGDKYTLLEVLPKTGRKHQIRVHLAHINHPIAGDEMYGFKNQPRPEGLSRQFLHAKSIKLKLTDGKEREFESQLAEDLENALSKLYDE